MQVRVPNALAPTVTIMPPGIGLQGRSVAESPNPFNPQRRLPTLLSPAHMGTKFRLHTVTTNYSLVFVRNVSLALPEQSWQSISLADWFQSDVQGLTRVCFVNSCASRICWPPPTSALLLQSPETH